MTANRSGAVSTRSWSGLFWAGLACWAFGFVWHIARPSLWILDLIAVPLTAMLYWCGFLAVAVAVVAGKRLTAAVTIVPVIAVLTVLVSPAWRIAPRTWFLLHRPLFDIALTTDPGNTFYGNKLPLPLRFLTVDGRVSDTGGARFFPQWIGIPDDAGGFLYSPDASPAGVDLYGSSCREPVDLGGGWWMCGLADSGI